MKVSDLLVKCLEAEGVRYVFGLPGEENEDLLFSLENSRVQFVPVRHEQGAAFMADVWGRLTGKAGVCLSTLGPGATNLMTGVADANLDKSPVVAITAQADLTRLHQESHQYLDTLSLFRPITKYGAAINSPEIVPEVVRKAFKIAESEKPGATHIQLPEDVARMESSRQEPMVASPVRRPDPDLQAIKQAIALLKSAKKPLVITGNGSVRKVTGTDLRTFVERHKIPACDTFMGAGAVSDRSPQSLHSLGFGFRDYVMDAVDQADLIICVGYDIAEYDPEHWNPRKDKTIIHIDFEEAEVYAHYQPAVEIVADVSASMRELNRLLEAERLIFDTVWYEGIQRKIREDISSYALRAGQSFTIPGVLSELRTVMNDDDLLISDVGSHKMWIARNFPVYLPNTCIFSNGLASMGIALPGAVAAALLNPKRRVVAAMGDGGFLMNSQELETARRLGIAMTVLIFNDNDYGLISWKQELSRGRSTGTRITNPDFKAYAESFGIPGYRPRSLAELRVQLKEAVNASGVCVLEVPVDPSVNLELIRKLEAASGK